MKSIKRLFGVDHALYDAWVIMMSELAWASRERERPGRCWFSNGIQETDNDQASSRISCFVLFLDFKSSPLPSRKQQDSAWRRRVKRAIIRDFLKETSEKTNDEERKREMRRNQRYKKWLIKRDWQVLEGSFLLLFLLFLWTTNCMDLSERPTERERVAEIPFSLVYHDIGKSRRINVSDLSRILIAYEWERKSYEIHVF